MKSFNFPCGCSYVEDWAGEPGVWALGLCQRHAWALIGISATVSLTAPCEPYDLDELVEKLCEWLGVEREMAQFKGRDKYPPAGIAADTSRKEKQWDCGCKIEYVEDTGKADGVTAVTLCHDHAWALFAVRAKVYCDARFYRGRLSELADALIFLIGSPEARDPKSEEWD